MLVQYASKIIIWHLKRGNPDSKLAIRVSNFSGPVSDFRILLRYYGLIPLLQWIIASEKHPSTSPRIQLLTRLQNLVNLAYYPLEHVYWLGLHQVIPLSPATRDRIGMWSCRFWAAYVVLYFAQLWEENKLLDTKEKLLSKKVEDDVQAAKELELIRQDRKSLYINTVINSAYFPLTIHWSLESSSLPDVGVGIFGTIAALAQIYTTWRVS